MKEKLLNKRTLPFLLIGAFTAVVLILYSTKPKPARDFKRPESKISVEVQTIEPTTFQAVIESYGLVEPLIESQLVAQVSGRIIELSEAFRDGGAFKEGDTLLRLDAADYEIEHAIALASLADAEQVLLEQQALAEQARQDWQTLGNGKKPTALTLREPQVAAAKAAVASAKAGVEKAKLNLQRTEITAPFDGRVLNKQVDLGQVVSLNTVLGNVYATNAVEVRLPIKNSDLPLLALPLNAEKPNQKTEVKIISTLTKQEVWQGQIVRVAGAMDQNSRQLYIVARIDDPFGKQAEGKFALKIGQYVTAEIAGTPIKNTIAIPVSSIYQGSYVYVYRDGAVHRQNVELAWQNPQEAVIASGLKAGDQLVLSPLGQVASGTAVKIKGAQPSQPVSDNSHARGSK